MSRECLCINYESGNGVCGGKFGSLHLFYVEFCTPDPEESHNTFLWFICLICCFK
jgi:hypothetical protein